MNCFSLNFSHGLTTSLVYLFNKSNMHNFLKSYQESQLYPKVQLAMKIMHQCPLSSSNSLAAVQKCWSPNARVCTSPRTSCIPMNAETDTGIPTTAWIAGFVQKAMSFQFRHCTSVWGVHLQHRAQKIADYTILRPRNIGKGYENFASKRIFVRQHFLQIWCHVSA